MHALLTQPSANAFAGFIAHVKLLMRVCSMLVRDANGILQAPDITVLSFHHSNTTPLKEAMGVLNHVQQVSAQGVRLLHLLANMLAELDALVRRILYKVVEHVTNAGTTDVTGALQKVTICINQQVAEKKLPNAVEKLPNVNVIKCNDSDAIVYLAKELCSSGVVGDELFNSLCAMLDDDIHGLNVRQGVCTCRGRGLPLLRSWVAATASAS